VVLNVQARRPRAVVRRIRNLAQNVSATVLLAFVVLKLVGAIAWSWWWVLSPLWINGIVLAAMLCAVVAPYLWRGRPLG
jgi:tellurite resistance protein TehA-like permease